MKNCSRKIFTRQIVMIAAAALLGAPAVAGSAHHTAGHDNADGNNGISLNLGKHDDGICDSQFEGLDDDRDVDFDFDSGDLVIEIDHEEELVITEAHDVIYKGRKLELSERGRELAGQYYHTFDDVLGDIADIAADAATLGVTTASRAILAAFTGGDTEEIERDAETRAGEIEQRADKMCDRIGRIRGIEAEMAREIRGFQPVIFMPADVI